MIFLPAVDGVYVGDIMIYPWTFERDVEIPSRFCPVKITLQAVAELPKIKVDSKT